MMSCISTVKQHHCIVSADSLPTTYGMVATDSEPQFLHSDISQQHHLAALLHQLLGQHSVAASTPQLHAQLCVSSFVYFMPAAPTTAASAEWCLQTSDSFWIFT